MTTSSAPSTQESKTSAHQFFSYSSPLGPLEIDLSPDGALRSLDFKETQAPPLPRSSEHRRALSRYFSNQGDLGDVPVDLRGTAFQKSVLRATRSIRRGEVRTYAWIAGKIGKPKAARAVGQALGSNPIPLVIPCHRVVGSSGLGGYTGGLDRKKALLEIEGASGN